MIVKSDVVERYNGMMRMLERQREELNLKMHLASMEVKQEWQALENSLEHLRSKGQMIVKETEDAAEEVEEAVHLLAEEIKEGYERIRKLL